MGIEGDKLFPLLEPLLDWRGKTVCEFGNQIVTWKWYPARDWYLKLGVRRYVSIDLNGGDGAIAKDLRDDLGDLGKFDVVTNHGCLEHLDGGTNGQVAGFTNAHRLLSYGGVVIHGIPLDPEYRGHAPVLYTRDFLHQLYGHNYYSIMLDRVIDGLHILAARNYQEVPFVFHPDAMKELRFYPGEGLRGAYR